ncbi:hypothetical protein R1sor_018089 [Riccia sorocarpa]|uniref:GIGANTEA n=1 Tax=Riccia sorocarpa TaxID=122646 RepID=A0ABD3I8V3_9MARC
MIRFGVADPVDSWNTSWAEILAYVELFGQFASESFVDEIGELVREHYPTSEHCLIDDVLATFVLHYPVHGHAVLHAILSCVIDGTVVYDKTTPPFGSFISLFRSSDEGAFTEQGALACGEILRVLTHYNRPTLKDDTGLSSGNPSSSSSSDGSGKSGQDERDGRLRTRLLTPWIVDSLLAAPPSMRSDYFQWCGGFMGKYATREELRPPTTVAGAGTRGKQPLLLPSSPRWAVAIGAAVIVSVCDDEVSRYGTADLTAAAVPALLIPPPTAQNERLVISGLPLLEPYARLFHRYYAVATPGATQRLLFGLLEAPPAWVPYALVVAVALVQLLRAADGYTPSVQLPRDWLKIHFLRPVGTALAQGPSSAADAAAAFLFHIFSQPTILFPPVSQSQGVFGGLLLYGSSSLSASREEANAAADQVNEDAVAASLAELMTSYGADVELKICSLWEAAYGLSSPGSTGQLPEVVLSEELQPPVLSWNLLRAHFRILSYLPPSTPSQACIKRTFSATVETILRRTFPLDEIMSLRDGFIGSLHPGGGGSKRMAMAELRSMVHCLFTESFLCSDLAAQLLSETLSLCFRHDAKRQLEQRIDLSNDTCGRRSPSMEESRYGGKDFGQGEVFRDRADAAGKQRGAVATFDSYVIAAVCALACEVQMLPFSPAYFTIPKPLPATTKQDADGQVSGSGPPDGHKSPGVTCRFPTGVASVVEHTNRLLGLLELLLGVSAEFGSSSSSSSSSASTNEILGGAVVAAHMTDLLGRSRACLHSLTGIMRCKWDPGICLKASAVLSAIERNGDLVAMTNRGKNGIGVKEHNLRTKTDSEQVLNTSSEELHKYSSCFSPTSKVGIFDTATTSSGRISTDLEGESLEPLPLEASDIAFIMCRDKRDGRRGSLNASLKAVLVGKQHLALGAAALLCRRLITVPDIPSITDGTRAEREVGQVVEALCNLASAFPENVAPFIISQADMELRPWIEMDDGLSQQSVWRVNTHIVCLLSELLRLTHLPQVVNVVVGDGNLLRRATDGMTLDGEACKLPQLELLEAAVLAVQAAIKWDVPNEDVAHKLFALLRDRLPATVRCLSHNSAHVRAMGVARLKDMLDMESLWSSSSKKSSEAGEREEQNGCGNWRKYVEQCVVWEVHCRRAGGMSISLLSNAASALGCPISI